MKVGGFEFSAGDLPKSSRIALYCTVHAEAYICKMSVTYLVPDDEQVPDEDWIADPRVRAAMIAAPAIGFTSTRSGHNPMLILDQLWRAGSETVLPYPDYAEAARDSFPVSEGQTDIGEPFFRY